MKEEKIVWRWWFAWKMEKLESWIEEMEKDGWNLFKADFTSFSPMRLKFEKGESRKIRYCCDYQIKVDDNYFLIFEEDGWKLADDKSGPWYIWYKSYEGERPEIYTDPAALIQRNNVQIRNIFIGVLLSVFLLFVVIVGNFDSTKLISAVLLLSFVFYGYAVAQLHRSNIKLKKDAIKGF